MKLSITLCLILLLKIVNGQSNEANHSGKIDLSTYVWKVYDSLKTKGASTLISVERSFFGMRVLDTLGGPDLYFDIFWQIKDSAYFQELKFYSDRVIRNPVKTLHYTDIFPIVSKYYDSIKMEEILPFVIKSKRNGIDGYEPLSPIHKTTYDLLLFSKNEMTQKRFEDSYIRENFGEDLPNLNYRFNQSTKLKMLWEKLWVIIGMED